MRTIHYCLYKEPPYYVAQCLNVDLSSFGVRCEEAVQNLKEAVELYFEGESNADFTAVSEVTAGEELTRA